LPPPKAIKCDRWVERFLKFSKMNVNSLKNQLQKIGIRPGLFDVVFWAYCEKFVGNGKNFTSHFQILVSEKQH
jgi:hypothetical protein